MALMFDDSTSLVLVNAVVQEEELALKEFGLELAGADEDSDVFG